MYFYFGFFVCDYHVVLEDIWYFNKYKKQKRLLVRAFNALACKLPHCVWVAIKNWHSFVFLIHHGGAYLSGRRMWWISLWFVAIWRFFLSHPWFPRFTFQNFTRTLQFIFPSDLVYIISFDMFYLNYFIELKFIFNFIFIQFFNMTYLIYILLITI